MFDHIYFDLLNFVGDIPVHYSISNGNRTEWSPIWSVIIRVINKIGRPRRGSPICLIKTELDDTKFCYQLIITLTKFVIY